MELTPEELHDWADETKPKLSDLTNTAGADHPEAIHTPPSGWAPGVRIREDGTGEAVARLDPGETPQWDKILTEMGYGDVLEFVRVVEVRSWEVFSKHAHGNDCPGVRQLRYVKAKVVRRMSADDRRDIDDLKGWILSSDPGPMVKIPPLGSGTLITFFADWQMGKREGGGSRATVEKIVGCFHQLVEYVGLLRSIGIQIRDLIVCGMGDMVEACSGHYAMQTHQVDLHMREQRAVVRRLLITSAKIFRPHFDRITYRAVPGNHGEERRNGKAFTSFSDNNDVCIFDQFRDVIQEASWAEGVEVLTTSMTEPQLSMSFEVGSGADIVRVGLAHGHQAGSHSKGDPAGKVKGWWDKCAASRHPIGYVDILNTGHYHHLRIEDRGARKTWFQCPTIDGGSFWWWAKGGTGSVPGMLTYVIDPADPRGWSWAKVLPGVA